MKEETERVEHYRSHEQIKHYVNDDDRVDDKDNNDNDNKEE
jgi:hypothetical protein